MAISFVFRLFDFEFRRERGSFLSGVIKLLKEVAFDFGVEE